MKKASVHLEYEVDIALALRAEREGTTKAALIRAALRDAAAGFTNVKPRARGAFAGPTDLADNADEYLPTSGFGAT